MITKFKTAIVAAALLVAAATPSFAQEAETPNTWNPPAAYTDAETGENYDIVVGDPKAPVTIYEYASLTCSHCAAFSTESHDEIKRDFIDTGRVSLEVRNFIRDPLDATAAAIVRCAPVDRYFPLQENVFASQEELFAGVKGNEAAGEAAMKLPPAQRFPALAKALKLDQFFQ